MAASLSSAPTTPTSNFKSLLPPRNPASSKQYHRSSRSSCAVPSHLRASRPIASLYRKVAAHSQRKAGLFHQQNILKHLITMKWTISCVLLSALLSTSAVAGGASNSRRSLDLSFRAENVNVVKRTRLDIGGPHGPVDSDKLRMVRRTAPAEKRGAMPAGIPMMDIGTGPIVGLVERGDIHYKHNGKQGTAANSASTSSSGSSTSSSSTSSSSSSTSSSDDSDEYCEEDDEDDDEEDCDEEDDEDDTEDCDEEDDTSASSSSSSSSASVAATSKVQAAYAAHPSSSANSASSTATPSSTSSSAAASSSSATGSGTTYTGTATWFTQGGNAGACGIYHQDSDLIVAMDSRMYSNGAYCGKSVVIKNTKTGKSVTAVVADECPSCESSGSLDLSTGLFKALDSSLDDGVFPISWQFA